MNMSGKELTASGIFQSLQEELGRSKFLLAVDVNVGT